MIDKELKLSLPMDSILDLLFQVKNDRLLLRLKLEETEKTINEMREMYNSKQNKWLEAKEALEYANLKLRSRVVELENMLEKKPIKLTFEELNDLAHDNKEIKDMYENSHEFKLIADYMVRGIQKSELLVVLKDICKINQELRKKVQNDYDNHVCIGPPPY